MPHDTPSQAYRTLLYHADKSASAASVQSLSPVKSSARPQSTFYLLSDGPSIRNRRITNADFRLCSTYKSHSQAPFYVYALRLIANQAEGTIALLRYSLGGDRPSQTAQLTLSCIRIHG